jgi:hypothetical protein
MRQFMHTPTVIEAVLCSDAIKYSKGDWKSLPSWLSEKYERGEVIFRSAGIDMKTLEGWLTAQPTDWIIKGVLGEVYPCKASAFEKLYTEVKA